MRLSHIMLATILVSLPASVPGQTPKDDWNRCRSENSEQAIAGCTAIIESGQQKGAELTRAFYSRGRAYARQVDYDHAMQDFERALQLSPNDAKALDGRGSVYAQKGDYDH